jgi:hypothetical protein
MPTFLSFLTPALSFTYLSQAWLGSDDEYQATLLSGRTLDNMAVFKKPLRLKSSSKAGQWTPVLLSS